MSDIVDRLPERLTRRPVRDVTPFVLDGLDQQLACDGTPASALVIRETKTGRKGHRAIGIGPSVVAEMRAHRDEQAAQATEHLLPAPVWVFSHDAGVSPWRPDFVTLKFNRLRKSVGLQHVRLHDLRHFVATSMLSDGVPVSTVSKRLGHARSSTTLDRDSHWMPAVDADAADRLDARLS